MRKFLRLLTVASVLTATPALACLPLNGLAEEMTAMTVRGEGRAYFHRTETERAGCPAAGPSCRTGAYLVAGDAVVVTETAGGFACASFVDRRGRQTSGFIAASALAAGAPEARIDWTGNWISGPERRITITRAEGRLRASGDATWGASDPDRVRRGAINIGSFEADLEPRGAEVGFTVGLNGETLPYERGGRSDCRIRLARRGPYLLVEDNLSCGGNNVSFTGMYRRR